MPQTDRMQKLQAMLEKDAGDPFLLFAMGNWRRSVNLLITDSVR